MMANTKPMNRPIGTNTGEDNKDIYVSWQEEEIARLRRQLDDLSNSTTSQIERDANEIIQLQRLIEELSAENNELANDLQDCIMEEKNLCESISELQEKNRALMERYKRVTAERDNLADMLEKEQEQTANSLEAHELTQDIRNVCNRKVKLLIDENSQLECAMRSQQLEMNSTMETITQINAQLESSMRSQQLEMGSMMEAITQITTKDATSELRVLYLEKFISTIQRDVERSVELNNSLETVLGCENAEGMAKFKPIFHKQHEQLLQVNCALLNEELQIKKQSGAPRVNCLHRPEFERSKSLDLAKPKPTRREGKSKSEMFSNMPDLSVFWSQQRSLAESSPHESSSTTSAQHDPYMLKSVLSFFPSKVTERFNSLVSAKPDLFFHANAVDLLEDFGTSNRAKNDDSNTCAIKKSTNVPNETKTADDSSSNVSEFF